MNTRKNRYGIEGVPGKTISNHASPPRSFGNNTGYNRNNGLSEESYRIFDEMMRQPQSRSRAEVIRLLVSQPRKK